MGLSNIPQHARTQKPIPPAGIHPAICYAIIDMGVHQESYQGNPPRNVQKLKMCFEFPTLPEQVFDETKGPQRLSIMQDYNVSTGDKATLIKMLKQWRNVQAIDLAKDLKAYLGAPCTILVKHSTKDGITYANIEQAGLMVMPPTQALGEPKNPKVFFDTDNFSWPVFHSLWKFIQDKLRASVEWNNIVAKHGPEPAVQQQAAPQQSFAQPVQQQFQQPIQQMPNHNQMVNAAPSFANPVQQVQAPAFNSGHGVNQPVSNVNTQVFQPNVVEQVTGIIVDNGTPPSF